MGGVGMWTIALALMASQGTHPAAALCASQLRVSCSPPVFLTLPIRGYVLKCFCASSHIFVSRLAHRQPGGLAGRLAACCRISVCCARVHSLHCVGTRGPWEC
jgi:hypothetical protein